MKKRALVPVLYLYAEAVKVKNTTEYLYFSALSRYLNYALKPYDNLNAMQKDVKNKQKQDIVVAVVDFDVDQNNLAHSLNAREKSILAIQKKVPDVQIVLSNRFWENWIVYHFEDCSRFEEDVFKLPIPFYSKDKSWYLSNMPALFAEMENAKSRAKRRRSSLISAFPIHQKDSFPILKLGSIKALHDSQAFTYVDVLIEKLQIFSN